jgi:hypothetical protein
VLKLDADAAPSAQLKPCPDMGLSLKSDTAEVYERANNAS